MKKLLIAGLCLSSTGLLAQKELKTTAINLFKNGTYFVVKEGTVDASKGYWAMSMKNFSPLLSTFWLNTTKDAPIDRIEYLNDTIKTSRFITNHFDALNANKGKKVRLTYTIGSAGTTISSAKGTLENFYPISNMAKIKTQEGSYLFLNTNTIQEVFFDENPNEKVKVDSLALMARIFFDKPKNNLPIKLSYMQSGMNWVPSYSIKMIDEGKLQLAMNALVENYSEDIKETELTLTLGAANFKYGSQIDPLSQGWVSTLSTLYPNYNRNDNNYNYQATYSNAMVAREMQQMTGSYGGSELDAISYDDISNFVTEGSKDEDLYRYKLGKVTIPKNSKTSFSIFSSEIPYEDIYEINIQDVVNYATNQRIAINEDQHFDVFHSLKLTNNTNVPLTTGPVFVQDKNLQPLAQDQIKYTASGAKVKVQLAKATDIMVKHTEEEISSEEKAKKYNSYYYKRVVIKGTIKIENNQQKAIKVNMCKYINGDLKEVSDSGVIKKSGKYNGLNPYSESEWTINLNKGEKKNITYSYEVYIYQGY